MLCAALADAGAHKASAKSTLHEILHTQGAEAVV